jgi:hypothetical protein
MHLQFSNCNGRLRKDRDLISPIGLGQTPQPGHSHSARHKLKTAASGQPFSSYVKAHRTNFKPGSFTQPINANNLPSAAEIAGPAPASTPSTAVSSLPSPLLPGEAV